MGTAGCLFLKMFLFVGGAHPFLKDHCFVTPSAVPTNSAHLLDDVAREHLFLREIMPKPRGAGPRKPAAKRKNNNLLKEEGRGKRVLKDVQIVPISERRFDGSLHYGQTTM